MEKVISVTYRGSSSSSNEFARKKGDQHEQINKMLEDGWRVKLAVAFSEPVAVANGQCVKTEEVYGKYGMTFVLEK